MDLPHYPPESQTSSPPSFVISNDLRGHEIPRESKSVIMRPIFLYGTLMSAKLLAELLTGDRKNEDWVKMRRKPAILFGYTRRAVVDADYPGVVQGSKEDRVKGYLFYPRHQQDLQKIADFENESYTREVVEVVVNELTATMAYTYLWCDDIDDLCAEDWDFEEFERTCIL